MDNDKMDSVESMENSLIGIMKNTDFFSMKITGQEITATTSIIKDLALDSIQLLEYLVTVENELSLNLDYQDLSIEVFENFHTLAQYFYQKLQMEG